MSSLHTFLVSWELLTSFLRGSLADACDCQAFLNFVEILQIQAADDNQPPRSSHCGSVVMNPTSIHENSGLIPGLAQWVKDPMFL